MATSLVWRSNFIRLILAVFISELGGYVTNVAIYLYIFQRTGGDLFYLGIAQVLFVAPLLVGTIFGGVIGEKICRLRIMITCECFNLLLLIGMIMGQGDIVSVILIRGCIVLFSGVFNPSRLAVLRDLVPQRSLTFVNGAFSSSYALLHFGGPLIGAAAYQAFPHLVPILEINTLTYFISIILLMTIYLNQRPLPRSDGNKMTINHFTRDLIEGARMVGGRRDLAALWRTCAIGGICLGIFFPTLQPFIQERLGRGIEGYAILLSAFGAGGILGGLGSSFLVNKLGTGRIMVFVGVLQSVLLFLWTQISNLYVSYICLMGWGAGMMVMVAAYMGYVQMNTSSSFHSRAFSLFDQSISLNAIFGAGIVSIVGDSLSAYQLLSVTSLILLFLVVLNVLSRGGRLLYERKV